ncbi:MAG: D-glycero-beta-D-manno-heptose 1,7-bisphosphate 7-phosphatase [Candidatus Marinimicrobia bacterium]|nr:D-glycero-beta-D-manno-heptose 1,7-bisphosphate 7-phosphatase [Candidatus Neomarinimicrobiota bacterium]
MNKAIFLDRDGTLNYDSENYVKSIAEFKIFKNTPEAIRIFSQSGYLVIIITNQSGISRDYFSKKELQHMHDKLKSAVKSEGGRIDAIYYCPHHPDDNCDCRKPGLANVRKAIKRFDIDQSNSYFIGDSKKDITTGAKAGCRTILVRTGIKNYRPEDIIKWKFKPDHIMDDILTAAKMITNKQK